MSTRFLFGTALTMILVTDLTLSQDETVEVANPLPFARLYSDPTGQSHFSDEQQTFSLVEFSPDLAPVSVAEVISAKSATVLSAPAHGVADWHPVPRRQINIVLAGEVEIEVSDGEKRKFGPGGYILGEDTEGIGHITRVVSDVDAYFVVITLNAINEQ